MVQKGRNGRYNFLNKYPVKYNDGLLQYHTLYYGGLKKTGYILLLSLKYTKLAISRPTCWRDCSISEI